MQTKLNNRIVINPKIMVGKPIIKGTRITVEMILRLLAQGLNTKEIIENYPHLKKQDIYAAIEYASQVLATETIFPITATTYGKSKAIA